ncbi:MAG: protein-L-isoaspartate(D-aspartate) O-methyltransferase [Candidatus Eremiobacteraeota bacterium]|nr:protein-L-isoaspartate(D-aspartate) O-methyltransferase [Candidatus Eremiobacteraeota bacterium]
MPRALFLALIFLFSLAIPGCQAGPQQNEAATPEAMREAMVKTQLENRGIKDKAVLDAMRRIPRHLFVPGNLKTRACEDNPLPIGSGQTISQPYVVALMTESLKLSKSDRVLEIGTGSGYQAAVLAEIVKEVYSIEIIKELADRAKKTLESQKYKNVTVKCGDGYAGWKEHAPFDAIIVTAAAEKIPQPLIDQLKPGGRLSIPVGPQKEVQKLMLLTKRADGSIEKTCITEVLFVPLTREK